jgi:hypothetical protein
MSSKKLLMLSNKETHKTDMMYLSKKNVYDLQDAKHSVSAAQIQPRNNLLKKSLVDVEK